MMIRVWNSIIRSSFKVYSLAVHHRPGSTTERTSYDVLIQQNTQLHTNTHTHTRSETFTRTRTGARALEIATLANRTERSLLVKTKVTFTDFFENTVHADNHSNNDEASANASAYSGRHKCVHVYIALNQILF